MRDGCVRRSATGWRALVAALVLGLALAPAAAAASPPDAPVADAAERSDGAAVRALIAEGADVNAPQGDGMTGLHWAAERGDLGIVDALLEAGARLEPTTRRGDYTPLHLASRAGQAEAVARLLEAGADPGARSSTGATPLHFAAAAGAAGAVGALVEHGADVDARESSWGQTPLMFAAAQNRTGAVRALLERGADPSRTAKVVDLAARERTDREERRRREERIEALRERGDEEALDAEAVRLVTEVESSGERDASAAPDRDPAGSDEESSRGGADTGEEESEPQPLSYAELVGTYGGLGAIHLAAREGHREAVRALLDGGDEVDRLTAGVSRTPLLIATINGHYDLAMELLRRGADPDHRSATGATPLFTTLNTRWIPKSRHPQPNHYTQQEASYLELMEALLEAGADPNARLERDLWYNEYSRTYLGVDMTGATPFWRAAHALDVEAMKLLVSHGADPAIPTRKPPERRRRYGGDEAGDRDPSGLPPASAGDPGVPPVVAAAGVGYGGGDGSGRAGNTHRHAPDGWLPAMRYLVEEIGADVNARDHNGYAALHFAAGRGDNDLIRYLVERGADVTVVSRRGQTTVDLANGPVQRVSPFPATIELLESLGAKNNHDCVSC